MYVQVIAADQNKKRARKDANTQLKQIFKHFDFKLIHQPLTNRLFDR